MPNDIAEIDEPIDVEFSKVADEEYNRLIERLNEEFPPVSRKGFDFSRIRGTVRGRTAKAIVLHLSCHGWSLGEIADTIGVPVEAVHRYHQTALQEVSPLDDIELARNFELRKLDAMERSAWEQFERSCEDAITEETGWEIEDEEGKTHRVAEFTPGSQAVTKRTRKGQSGNPAYKKLLLDISKRRAALLGLDKPSKVEIDKTERKMQITVIEVKNREEAIAAEAQGLLSPPGK